MKTAPLVWAGTVLALLLAGPASADDRWPSEEPSPWAQFGADVHRFNTGTQKFFTDAGDGTWRLIEGAGNGTLKLANDAGSGTKQLLDGAGNGVKGFFTGIGDAMNWNRPQPRRNTGYGYSPWIRDPQTGRYVQPSRTPSKRSWLDSLFARKEPKPPATVGEFLSLPRSDPW